MIAIAGQFAVKSRAIVSHSDNYEMLLIRVGHHLWRWSKYSIKHHALAEATVFQMACESVWEAKAAYRKPFLERKEANKQATATRLRKKAK